MSVEREFYREHVTSRVNERLVRLAALSVAVTHVESRRYHDFELNIVPAMRSANFHVGLMLSAFPRGISVERRAHQGGHHVEVFSGPVSISTLTRSEMPRTLPTQPYRTILGEPWWQAELNFPGANSQRPDPPQNPRLHAVLAFGAEFRSKHLELCSVLFPDKDGKLAGGSINLLWEYRHIVREFDDREYVSRQVMQFVSERNALVS